MGFSLLVGSNTKSGGQWNIEDVELCDYPTVFNFQALKVSNAKATHIAVDRIISSPLQFLKFAFTKKIENLWGIESSVAISYAGNPNQYSRFMKSLMGIATIYLFFLLILVTYVTYKHFKDYIVFNELREKKVCDYAFLLCCSILLLVSSHIFIEVQPRYHIIMYPLFILLIGCFLG